MEAKLPEGITNLTFPNQLIRVAKLSVEDPTQIGLELVWFGAILWSCIII